jgi:hypothetical protein
MADVATPSSAAMFDGGAQDKKEKKVVEKPEKPDEEAYKAALKKAEKEHSTSMDKFVSAIPLSFSSMSAKTFESERKDARQPAVTHTNTFYAECDQGAT